VEGRKAGASKRRPDRRDGQGAFRLLQQLQALPRTFKLIRQVLRESYQFRMPLLAQSGRSYANGISWSITNE
jgi:hypothetical protein